MAGAISRWNPICKGHFGTYIVNKAGTSVLNNGKILKDCIDFDYLYFVK